jgi:putative methylase
MGEYAQKRVIRKLDLELFLSQIAPQPTPQAHLEQYTISPSIASNILYLAAYVNSDIMRRSVLDLGCGTGRLSIGASYLGAETIVGIDIDKLAIKTAVENTLKTNQAKRIQWVMGDINCVIGRFNTVLQNPPFGVQTREADRAFLAKALEVGDSIYSLHNHPVIDRQLIKQLKASKGFLEVSPSPFLEEFVSKHNGVVKGVYAMIMTIPKMFEFHTKLKHDFIVDLYVIKRVYAK